MNEKQLRLQELDRLWLSYLRASELDDPIRANQLVRDMILHCNRLLISVFDFMQNKTAEGIAIQLKPAKLAVKPSEGEAPPFLPAQLAAEALPLSASSLAPIAEPLRHAESAPGYSCSECGRSFASSHALRGHQRTHKQGIRI